MTDDHSKVGEQRAYELGNRGPIEFDVNGMLREEITEAYWRTGFYVFEGVVQGEELDELIAEFEHLLTRAPTSSTASTDAAGRPAIGTEFEQPSFRFAKPLSDPYGGTGRYGAKMNELKAPADAPEERSRIIALAIDARHQCFPHEPRYHYQPLADELDTLRWNDFTREHLLKNYNLKDMGI